LLMTRRLTDLLASFIINKYILQLSDIFRLIMQI
jgi:hypothetical protein